MTEQINCPFCGNLIDRNAIKCKNCDALFKEPELPNIKFKELAPFLVIDILTIGFFSTIWFFINGKAINNLVENNNKKWYKPWTWFQESGHYRDIMETRNYVDGNALSTKLVLPVQKHLYENLQGATQYAREQTNFIKREFSKKFDELDQVLQQKLNELQECASDEKNAERRIRESQERLDWLENVQNEINAILEI